MKSRKSIWLVSSAVLFCVILASCASTHVTVNPGATFPIAVSDKSPAFLFPTNLSHAGVTGDTNAMGVSVSAGIAAKFGAKVVSGQQLFDLVGNLSYELAEAIKAQVDAKDYKLEGSAEGTATELAGVMDKILETLSGLKLIPEGYKFKYIIAVHTHGSADMVPGSVKMDSWGGIYDIGTKEILAYIEQSNTVVNQEAAVLGQLPGVYNGIIQHLIDGK